MALDGLFCANVLLRTYSLTHPMSCLLVFGLIKGDVQRVIELRARGFKDSTWKRWDGMSRSEHICIISHYTVLSHMHGYG